MEAFVKSLFDRLEGDSKMKLFAIMQGAIDEMHNSGMIARADPAGTSKLHDEDPEVRLTEKTSLAKSVGKAHIPSAAPSIAPDGALVYTAQVNYDPKFRRSICICLQGGLEGLHISGATKERRVRYNVVVQANGHDTADFAQLISRLDEFYDDIELRMSTAEAPGRPEAVEPAKPAKKPGFFARLFGKG